jgi:hypothetical protein
MKRLLPLLAVAIVISFSGTPATGQSTVPQGFNYQAVVRNATGNPVINTAVKVSIGILSDTIANTLVWEEEHSVTTNGYGLVSLVIGGPLGVRTGGSVNSFSAIDWSASQMFIYIKIKNPASASIWTPMGKVKLWSVPYSLVSARTERDLSSPFLFNGDTVFIMQNFVVGSDMPLRAQMAVVSTDDKSDEPLFEVRRKDGQPVFTVFNDAVTINVPFSDGKGSPSRGGFAIGGFDETKGTFVADLFRVTPDSIRMYINNNPAGTKGSPSRGGFAIGGFDETKAAGDMYLNVTASSIVGVVTSTPQLLWYPRKEAFLAGRVQIASPDSVGLNSSALGYHSMAKGGWSQAFGYRSVASGTYSTAIGKLALAAMPNSFAFGNNAKATSSDSYAFGSGAEASGAYSFAFGSVGFNDSGNSTTTPTKASGQYSMALGMGAAASNKGAMALGVQTTASGLASSTLGYWSTASKPYSIAIGYKAAASGDYATAIGYQATAAGNYSASIGYNTTASAVNSFVFGASSSATASNAIALGAGNIASGTNSSVLGYQSQANGERSLAIGSYYSYSYLVPVIELGKDEETKAEDDFLPIRPILPITTMTQTYNRANISNGQYSVAVGNGNLAENGGFVFGSNSDAVAFGSVALGTSAKATERNAFAAGYGSVANGVYSIAFGSNVVANSYGEIALGQWNDIMTGTATSWNENDLLFTIGNGVNNDNRSNAMTIFKNGKTIVRGRYAVSTFNNKTLRLVLDPQSGEYYWANNVYGIFTNLRRDDPLIEYYYSGFFISTGKEGTYRGLYADERTGASVDVAEYIYDTYGNTESAEVVVADPVTNVSVIRSTRPYQTSVVGVVSSDPHMTMGMELVVDKTTGVPLKDGRHAVRLALTGRVPVKITDENGPVIPGDLLTTSSTPGHAMKWTLLDVSTAKDFDELKTMMAENERRRSAIIGKALEAHESGAGKIMVLITL